MFYKETNFQDTKTGRIPSDWQDATLSDLSEHITKGTTPTTYGFSYEPSGVNFIKVESIDENGKFIVENVPHISKEANKALSRSILKDNDILFSIAGALGRVALVTDDILPANVNQALSIVRIKDKEKVLPEYLKYFLMGPNVQGFIKSIAIQSQQANLNLEQVRDFKVGLPPIAEQRAIVGVLGVVDSALELADRVIAKCERLKRGLMQQLLTRGIGHTEYMQATIGTIPSNWKVIQIKDIASVKEGLYGKRGNGNIIQLKADSIRDNGKINAKAFAKIESDRDISNYLLKPGDVLFNNRNSAELVGKCAVFMGEFDECVYSNLLTRIRLHSKEVTSQWVVYSLTKLHKTGRLKNISTRAVNQALLKKETVENLAIPIPPSLEQNKITEILLTIDKKLELEKDERRRLERLKQGLMNLLLAGKVRIKVD